MSALTQTRQRRTASVEEALCDGGSCQQRGRPPRSASTASSCFLDQWRRSLTGMPSSQSWSHASSSSTIGRRPRQRSHTRRRYADQVAWQRCQWPFISGPGISIQKGQRASRGMSWPLQILVTNRGFSWGSPWRKFLSALAPSCPQARMLAKAPAPRYV